MQTQVSSLADLDVLVRLVVDFRDTLLRAEVDDIQLKNVLRHLVANGKADFFLGTDEEGSVFLVAGVRKRLWKICL